MPSTMMPQHVLACRAGYGSGGLGQHFSHVIEQARATEPGMVYLSRRPKRGDPAGIAIGDSLTPLLLKWTPLRWSPGGADYFDNDRFDQSVAKRLSGPMASFTGFGGQSLRSFRRARAIGCAMLRLLAGNSHINNVRRQHEKAMRRWPLESSWLNEAQRLKTLAEYEMANEILVGSQYSWESFVEAGVAESKLRRIHYPADSRFQLAGHGAPSEDGVFRIVYVGSITIFKGVPLLLEAFSRVSHANAQLTLVGGTATRGMRRYMERWLQRDARIKLAPGDPMPHLQRANVCVHPSFEDSLAYACLETLAAGVPLIVSDHTGAKEYIRAGENGWVVPTGDLDALVGRLQLLANAAVR